MELREWLEKNKVLLAKRWLAEIEARWDPGERNQDALLLAFLHRLVALLPGCVGHRRESAEELLPRAGSLPAQIIMPPSSAM